MAADSEAQVKGRLEWIGKIAQPVIGVGLMALCAWVIKIEVNIAELDTSQKENAAQWKVLYEHRQVADKFKEELVDLEIEVEVYKRLFNLVLDHKDLIKPTAAAMPTRVPLFGEDNSWINGNGDTAVAADDNKPSAPKLAEKKEDKQQKLYGDKIDEFRHQQMNNILEQRSPVLEDK